MDTKTIIGGIFAVLGVISIFAMSPGGSSTNQPIPQRAGKKTRRKRR
jgi:hypothetical protein